MNGYQLTERCGGFLKTVSISMLTILMVLFNTGCTPTYDEKKGYKEASINPLFPVPENAVQSELEYGNPIIKDGVKYTIKNIGGEQGLYPPKDYLTEIENWGWYELEEERMGSMHVFNRDGTVMWLDINQDFIGLYELERNIYSIK
ncbi:hypothetical protein IM538_00070 [Cytobacillus suaedae]|nr:hypothetical protein IM538_00070 [Cytobacillus suaedae]